MLARIEPDRLKAMLARSHLQALVKASIDACPVDTGAERLPSDAAPPAVVEAGRTPRRR